MNGTATKVGSLLRNLPLKLDFDGFSGQTGATTESRSQSQ